MFQGFSKETGEFLWELSFHNERPWFLEHKEQFERVVNQPFKALAKDTAALLQERFPDMLVDCHVSRIYRDARRLFGRGPYKDHLWFTLWDSVGGKSGPAFWFEIGPATYTYGMGFFEAAPAEMELYRRSIDANPARFARLAGDIDALGKYKVIGPSYARPKGSYDEPVKSWYERKWVGAERTRDLEGEAFSPELPRILVDAFEELTPMFRFLLEVHQTASGAGRKEDRHG
jgi:uncharacterized protein (TIGR02453 family)